MHAGADASCVDTSWADKRNRQEEQRLGMHPPAGSDRSVALAVGTINCEQGTDPDGVGVRPRFSRV